MLKTIHRILSSAVTRWGLASALVVAFALTLPPTVQGYNRWLVALPALLITQGIATFVLLLLSRLLEPIVQGQERRGPSPLREVLSWSGAAALFGLTVPTLPGLLSIFAFARALRVLGASQSAILIAGGVFALIVMAIVGWLGFRIGNRARALALQLQRPPQPRPSDLLGLKDMADEAARATAEYPWLFAGYFGLVVVGLGVLASLGAAIPVLALGAGLLAGN
jgi:hypothetical protein